MNRPHKKRNEHLLYLVGAHKDMLEKTVSITSMLIELAPQIDFDEILPEIDNRDRLIEIITTLQKEIDTILAKCSPIEITPEIQQTLKDWNSSCEINFAKVEQLNLKLVETLTEMKDQTQNEINEVRGNRTKIGGYNLNNVKR